MSGVAAAARPPGGRARSTQRIDTPGYLRCSHAVKTARGPGFLTTVVQLDLHAVGVGDRQVRRGGGAVVAHRVTRLLQPGTQVRQRPAVTRPRLTSATGDTGSSAERGPGAGEPEAAEERLGPRGVRGSADGDDVDRRRLRLVPEVAVQVAHRLVEPHAQPNGSRTAPCTAYDSSQLATSWPSAARSAVALRASPTTNASDVLAAGTPVTAVRSAACTATPTTPTTPTTQDRGTVSRGGDLATQPEQIEEPHHGRRVVAEPVRADGDEGAHRVVAC